MATWAQRLQLVKDAIDEILTTGQNVSYQGRSLGMANLSELRKLELAYTIEATNEAAKCKVRNRIIQVTPLS